MKQEQKLELENKYLGKKVHVIIDDPYHSIDAIGIVDSVDDIGQLHGTWGGLAAVPGKDTIELLEIDDYNYYQGEGCVLEVYAITDGKKTLVGEIAFNEDKSDAEQQAAALAMLQAKGYVFKGGK